MGGQLAGEVLAVSPAVQAAVADIVIVVHGADVIAGGAAAVPPSMVNGVNARVGPEAVPVGGLGVPPDVTDVLRQPSDLALTDVGIEVDRAVVVTVVQPEQLAVIEPVLLPAGRRGSQPLSLWLHGTPPLLRARCHPGWPQYQMSWPASILSATPAFHAG